jgi:hypothetical protein
MSNEQTEALVQTQMMLETIDRTNATNMADVRARIIANRKVLATPSPAPSDTLAKCDCARRHDPDQFDHEASCAYVRTANAPMTGTLEPVSQDARTQAQVAEVLLKREMQLMTDTLERREANERHIAALQRMKSRTPVYDGGDAKALTYQALHNALDAAILALSLPAREVSGERAREHDDRVALETLSDALNEIARVRDETRHSDGVSSEVRLAMKNGAVACWHMINALQGVILKRYPTGLPERLATTPAPRVKLEADLLELIDRLRPLAERRTVDEIMQGVADPEWDAASPERRIEMMGERKRKHDADVLAARATLNRLSGEG